MNEICWACEQPTIRTQEMIARAGRIGIDDGRVAWVSAGLEDADGAAQIVRVCLVCAIIARRAALVPVRRTNA